MNRSEIAVNKFKEGYNCAQSVLFSYADKLNISKDFALRISNGFGAGMGRKQEVCGAICGGILVLNLLYGRGENDEKQKQDINYSKVRGLINKFENIHNTINCKKLLGDCDLLTVEEQEKFNSENLIENCYKYVEDMIKILDKIIEE
jgi:C_GCAxxG_C_C family probable redox protein